MPAERIEKRSSYFMRANKRRYALRVIEKRKDIRLREDPAKLFDDFFTTSHSKKPVVNYGAPHRALSGNLSSVSNLRKRRRLTSHRLGSHFQIVHQASLPVSTRGSVRSRILKYSETDHFRIKRRSKRRRCEYVSRLRPFTCQSPLSPGLADTISAVSDP